LGRRGESEAVVSGDRPCWWCSKRLTNPFGKPVAGRERIVDGNTVKMHEICSRAFDLEYTKITAQPRTEPAKAGAAAKGGGKFDDMEDDIPF
jgi:hypothetical protein